MTADTAASSALVPEGVADLLFRSARTVNTFTDEDVTDDQIRAVWDVVRWGPTAMNSLPLRLLLVRTPTARERLVTHMADGNKVKTERAPLSIVVAADLDFHENLPRLAPHMPDVRDNLHTNEAARAGMSRDNAFLQLGYFIVGLRASGLQVGPMTGFDAAGVDADFFTGTGWRALAVLNVGHAPADLEDLGIPATWPRQARLEFEDIAQTA